MEQGQQGGGLKSFIVPYSIFVSLINVLFIFQGIDKGGWAALGIFFVVSPVANIIFLVFGSIRFAMLSRKYPATSSTAFWLLVYGLPVLFIVTGFVLLSFDSIIGRGGC